jgi:5-methylcytosine-specific restriction endonuclease McrA
MKRTRKRFLEERKKVLEYKVTPKKKYKYTKKKHIEYLLSEEWAKIRNDLFQTRGKECQRCGSKNQIQVHHLTYDNWKNEEPQDLEILCAKCHKSEHKKSPQN